MAQTKKSCPECDVDEIRARIIRTIREIYPVEYNFCREQLAKLVGCSSGHLSNCESAGEPLIEPSGLGGKVVYSFPRIVDFLVLQEIKTINRINEKLSKRKPGRPTKASVLLASKWDEHEKQ